MILKIGDYSCLATSKDIEIIRDFIDNDRSRVKTLSEFTQIPIEVEELSKVDPNKKYVYHIICDYDPDQNDIKIMEESFKNIEQDEAAFIFICHMVSIKRMNKDLLPFI